MGKPDPPQPPDPVETARASTSTNVGTAITNAFLNNVNRYSPDGATRYDQTGSYDWYDPYTGSTINIPTFSETTILSPQAQAIRNQTDTARFNLAGMANSQSARLASILNSSFDPMSVAPGRGDISTLTGGPSYMLDYGSSGDVMRSLGDAGQIASTFNDVGIVNRGFGDAGQVTRDYAPSDGFSADRQRVEQSLYDRMQPQLQRDRANLEQRLADQGIRYGSTAYSAAMDDYNRQSNDARLAVTAQGGAEQERLNNMAAQAAQFRNLAQQQAYQQELGRGTFANSAQQQEYLQALGRGTFANDAQRQRYEQMLSSGQFANAAQNQEFQQNAARGSFYNQGVSLDQQRRQALFGAQNDARTQYLNEIYAQRNQPLNEIAALLSGSQVQNPNFQTLPRNTIPTTDVAGLINTRFNQDMDIYRTEVQQSNALMGGLFGFAGGLIRSDETTKKDITPMGSVLTPSGEELPFYEWRYKEANKGTQKHVGPMAQDVERIDPSAVRDIDGVKHIDTARMGSVLGIG